MGYGEVVKKKAQMMVVSSGWYHTVQARGAPIVRDRSLHLHFTLADSAAVLLQGGRDWFSSLYCLRLHQIFLNLIYSPSQASTRLAVVKNELPILIRLTYQPQKRCYDAQIRSSVPIPYAEEVLCDHNPAT